MSPVRRIAMVSAHTSPLAQPGSGHGGGMNVYVHSLATALVRAGIECDVLSRVDRPGTRRVVEVEPGLRVVHLDAGPPRHLESLELVPHVEDLVTAAQRHLGEHGDFDLLHAHYWSSGAVAHCLKHRLDLPLVTTFHTLGHTKRAAGLEEPDIRLRIEGEVVACSDRIVASTEHELAELVDDYDAVPELVEVVPPGVDHSRFSPGDRGDARRRLGLPEGALLLFVGRIQPLKGLELALRSLAAMDLPDARLAVIGGPSGPEGVAEQTRLRALARELGVEHRVLWVAPRPHHALADWYRAADVCVVPSRTESFGLVALEAAACGTPVVAAEVGGLRALVDHGRTGFLVGERDPVAYAAAIERICTDAVLARDLGEQAIEESQGYTWSLTAARLRRVYADVGSRDLVQCR